MSTSLNLLLAAFLLVAVKATADEKAQSLTTNQTTAQADVSITAKKYKKTIEPPNPYIDEGACPFECCIYRQWTASKETVLFKQPRGKTKIGLLKVGEDVQAQTGIDYVVPSEMQVIFNCKNYKVGDRVYVLTEEGEGHYIVWYKGHLDNQNLDFLDMDSSQNCKSQSEDCWARMVKDHREEAEWWAELKTADGKIGWVKMENNFKHTDQCGE